MTGVDLEKGKIIRGSESWHWDSRVFRIVAYQRKLTTNQRKST